MIYDKLEHIRRYIGFCRNLDLAVEYISSHDLTALPDGKTVIAGDQVYCSVMDAQASSAEEKRYEFHKNYMDIQIDLRGTELIRIGDSSAMTIDSYEPETDFGSAHCPGLASCLIGPGNFILCMAGEPHMPGILTEHGSALKKCVFKVHI